MKTLLFLTIFISGTAVAQTNVIAAKSHASHKSTDENDPDNFGIVLPEKTVVRVVYLSDDCLIEIAEVTQMDTKYENDTICNHPFLQNGQIDVKRIKEMYQSNVKFIGFDALEKKQKKASKRLMREEKKKEKSSTLFIFLIGGTFFLAYLFVPKIRLSR